LGYRLGEEIMNRLQKKCMVASAIMHSLLLAVLFLSPAFMSSQKKVETIPVMTLIPGRLIDEKMAGGGSPNVSQPPPKSEPAATPPAAPVQPPPTPEPAPPENRITKSAPAVEPEPTPVKSSREPTPIPPKKSAKETPPAKSTKAEAPSNPKEKAPKKKIEIPDFDKPSDAANKQKADAAKKAREDKARARAEYASRLKDVSESLGKDLSTGTAFEAPGPGGEAYAYYGWAVRARFDEAWDPSNVAEPDGIVKITVTIRRDGTVLSSKITQPSSGAALNRSVQRALDRVKSVPPFPEDAKEEKRSFNLEFNLKAKRLSG
jgi:TonB family protein